MPLPHLPLARALAASTLLASVVPALAQEVVSLGDLFTGVGSIAHSNPEAFVAVGGWTLFTAADLEHGRELWRTDGTALGTSVVRDIDLGARGSRPEELTPLGGLVYFVAEDATAGRELWRTDGTSAGTVRVADLWPGPGSSGPAELTVAGGSLFFAATDEKVGRELWRLRPEWPAPELVADLRPGANGSNPSRLVPFADEERVAFRLTTASSGSELATSDGTEDGTQIFDLAPGAASSSPTPLVGVAGAVFLSASDDTYGIELWIATESTTQRLSDSYLDSASGRPEEATLLGRTLLFRARVGSSSYRLWRSDGTPGSTYEVAAVDPRGLAALSETHAVFASGGDLWITDGTSVGTQRLVEMTHPIREAISGADIWFVQYAGLLHFIAQGDGIWRTDGTAAGTARAVHPGGADWIDELGTGADGLYFQGIDDFAGAEPWRGAATATRLADVARDVGNANPVWFEAHAGRLYFGAEADGFGAELVSWDGDPGTATVVEDLYPGVISANPQVLHSTPLGLYYLARDPDFGSEPRRLIDPGLGSTLLDLVPGSDGSGAYPERSVGELVYFTGDDADNVDQLYAADAAGTLTQVTSFTEAYIEAFSSAALGSTLLFSAIDSLGYELWKSVGGGPAQRVVDLEPGPTGSNPRYLTVHGGTLYFAAQGGSLPGIYRSDGTAQNTTLVAATGWSLLLTSVGAQVLFIASTPETGAELWKTDGTSAGTALVRDIWPGSETSFLRLTLASAVASDEALFFAACDGATGVELWKSDGTLAGTQLVADLRPGPASSEPIELVALPDGGVVFRACDELAGCELWRSDGTAAGTRRVTDLAPGPASADPRGMKVFDDWVVFSGNDGATGREAWAYRWNPSSQIFQDGFETGDVAAWSP